MMCTTKEIQEKYVLCLTEVQNLREDLQIKSLFLDHSWQIKFLES